MELNVGRLSLGGEDVRKTSDFMSRLREGKNMRDSSKMLSSCTYRLLGEKREIVVTLHEGV